MHARSWFHRHLLTAASLALLACSNNSGGGGNQNNNNNQVPACPEGTVLSVTACVPVFDDCPAADEIPVLGGGCVAIGPARCAIGTGCASGFEDDGNGGCEPVLPASDCEDGTLALLGATTCAEIAACGDAPWGEIPDAPGTVHVDASYGGGASDGSRAAPFTTVTAALAVADASAVVAIAAGHYVESVSLASPVTLWGRCPDQVTLEGIESAGNGMPAVTLSPGAGGAVLRGLRLTGPGAGVVMNETPDVALEAVEIVDTGAYGLLLQRGAVARLDRVRIARARTAAVVLYGGALSVTRSEIRSTQPAPDDTFGRGIDAGCDHQGAGGCAVVEVTATVIRRNREAGLVISGGSATVTGSVVEDTLANAAHLGAGLGILAQCDTTLADCPVLTVEGSVVRGNRAIGVQGAGQETIIRGSVIASTQPQESDGRLGDGLVAQCDGSLDRCGTLEVTCSLIEASHHVGVFVSGIAAEVSHTIIRNTDAQESDLDSGFGLLAKCDLVTGQCATLDLVTSSLEANTYTGLFLHGASATVTGAYIADSVPDDTDAGGLAISAQCDVAVQSCPDLAVDASLFERSRAVSLSLFDTNGAMDRSSVYIVAEQPAGSQLGIGLYVERDTADASPIFDVSHSEIRDPFLTGLYYVGAAGEVSRCLIHGGQYSAILDQSEVSLDWMCELEGSVSSEPLVQ